MLGRLQKASIGIAVFVVVAGAVGYIRYEHYSRYFQETADAAIQADQVAISSKLAGYVRTVAVNDNQQVPAGAPLVEIDSADYRTKLAEADAQITAALAGETANRMARAEAETAVAASKANMQAVQANLAFTRREVARYGPLVAKGAEPASTLSQLIANRDRALADLASSQANLEQARRHVESISAQVTQQAAQADAARVQRQGAVNDLGATRLVAPISGRIAGRSVRVGQYVQPGLRLMTVVPAQDIYVIANFKETQIGLMRPGQPAKIHVDALPDVEFSGQVVSVTPGTGANFSMIPPQNATGNFTKIVQRVPVRIRIDAGPAARQVLAPGLSLEVEVDTRMASKDLEIIRAEQAGRTK